MASKDTFDGCVWWLRLVVDFCFPNPKSFVNRGFNFERREDQIPLCTLSFLYHILYFPYLKILFEGFYTWRPFWCFLLTMFCVLRYMFIHYFVVFK